jgi:enhancer of polycomb-like protein
VPYGERLFKYINGPSHAKAASTDQNSQRERQPHALRLRYGRGGRLHLDRRRPRLPAGRVLSFAEPSMESDDDEDEEMDEMMRERLDMELEDTRRRLQERWMFDEDDGPAMGPLGSEEQDRVLFDDFQSKSVFVPLFDLHVS